MVAGFFVYDLVFIPPYGTLTVGAAENWVALGVYVVVMLLVAQVVARLDAARAQAHSRETEIRRLFELTDLLIGEKPVPELLALIVSTVHDAFGLRSVALLLPVGYPPGDRRRLGRRAPHRTRAGPDHPGPGHARPAWGPSATGPDERPDRGPVGHRAGRSGCSAQRARCSAVTTASCCCTFANHIALTVERAQLREQALRTELLEEIDRLQKTLMGAVSHDLRTPLATIKISASTLRQPRGRPGRRRAPGAAGAHRGPGRPPQPAGHQPARHEPGAVRRPRAAPEPDRRGRPGDRGAARARPGRDGPTASPSTWPTTSPWSTSTISSSARSSPTCSTTPSRYAPDDTAIAVAGRDSAPTGTSRWR